MLVSLGFAVQAVLELGHLLADGPRGGPGRGRHVGTPHLQPAFVATGPAACRMRAGCSDARDAQNFSSEAE
jgi:hypothetical protein